MRNKKLNTNPASFFLLSFPGSASLFHSRCPWRWDEEWGLWSVHSSSSLLLRPSHTFPFSSTGPPQATVPSGVTHLFQHVVLNGLQSGYLLHHGLFQGLLLCFDTWSTNSLLLWPQCSHWCFSYLFAHSLLPMLCFSPFLEYIFLRHHHLSWGAQLCPAVGGWSHWNQLCPAWDSPSPYSQRPPAARAANTIKSTPNTKLQNN